MGKSKIEKLVESINEKNAEFGKEAAKFGNKAAARRARKLSLEITKLYKEYREISPKG